MGDWHFRIFILHPRTIMKFRTKDNLNNLRHRTREVIFRIHEKWEEWKMRGDMLRSPSCVEMTSTTLETSPVETAQNAGSFRETNVSFHMKKTFPLKAKTSKKK